MRSAVVRMPGVIAGPRSWGEAGRPALGWRSKRSIGLAMVIVIITAIAIFGAPKSAGQTPAAVEASSSMPPRGTENVVEVDGMSMPSQIVTLASVQPARIAAILAAEGASVRRGDLVAALEDGVQSAKTEMAKAAAETNLNVEHARTLWMHAQRDLDRLRTLHGDDHASSKEMSDVLSRAEVTRLEYELAGFHQGQAARAYERERHLLEEFRIRAPFDGYVREHHKHAGESVDQLEGVLTLVQLDPLLVQVDCPVALAPFMAVADRFWIRPVDPRWPVRVGRVVLANRVADGASQTFRVKLAVDNADAAWMAGLKVVVEFTHDGQTRPGARSVGSAPETGSAQTRDTDRGTVEHEER